MSTLFLVRHAQASFLSDDYDRLSELGIDQSRQLGRYLAGLERTVDAVFVGPRRRHAHTAEAALEQLPGPTPECLPELDEYPAQAVLEARIGALIAARPELEALTRDLADPDRTRRGRALDLLLREALRDWSTRHDATEAHESWSGFRGRARAALERLTRDPGRGRRVLVVSSAGTIGALAAEVLGAPAATALELGFMLNNSAVTEIAYSPGRTSLARFNVLAHLPDPGHWTRR